MKIEKAIEIISTYIDDPLITNKYDFIEALKLGIEAMEFFQEFQKVTGHHQDARLPGETEE